MLFIAVEPAMTPGLVAIRAARFESIRSSNYDEILRRLSPEPESDSWLIPKLSYPHPLFFIFKLYILRTVAVIAMSGPSHLGREETINGRDYYGCVCPLGIDSDGKTSRADCPATPLRIVPG